MSHRPPSSTESRGHTRRIMLVLLAYALGLIPFYFLTPVHQGIQRVLHPPGPTTTVTPAAGLNALVGKPPALATSGVGSIPASNSISATATPANRNASSTPGSSAAAWLLYAAKGDLWETNGDQTIQLTHNGHLSQPTLARDTLVYVEREKDYSDLWLAQPTAPPRRITHDASADVTADHWVMQPVILPGEDQIYVLSDQNKVTTGVGDLAIWRLDLLNGTMQQITHPPAYTGGDQDITLDPHEPGTIVFTRYTYADNGQLTEGLYWLAANSDQTIPLTTPDHPSRQASFAPDGVSLAFIQSDGRADDLYVGRIDTTGQPRLVNVQQMATGTIAEPVWSPDGMALAYIAVTNRQFQLWVRSIGRTADGTLELGQPHQITDGDGIDATSRPVWLTGALAAEMPSWLKAVN